MLPEQIKTIKDFGEFSFKEKASEFIAIVYPVDNQESALNHLNEIRKKHYDASHHCYAYKLKNGEEKYSENLRFRQELFPRFWKTVRSHATLLMDIYGP